LIWLSAFAGSFLFGLRIFGTQNPSVVAGLIQTERRLAKWGTVAGAGGIIISGWLLSTLPQGPQWGWFDVPLYPWLALKQLFFIVLVILIAIDIRRTNRILSLLQSENSPLKNQFGK
jgi:hypothetical protein